MADIITPILNIVSALLCSTCSANNRCCYLLDLQENKDDLNNALVELRATRNDVKRRVDGAEMNPNEPMKRTDEVDSWLQRVQTIDDEVVQIIQKVDQEIQGRCFEGNCPKNCWSAHKIGKLVIRELAIVNEHRSKGSFGDVAYRLLPPLVQREPVDSTVGMESMFDKVWRLLAEDDVRIMGLYGYGGVGKTTLLKQINNEFLESTTRSTHGFDVVILVVVSKVTNIVAIQKEIGKRLELSSPNRTNIFNTLTKKNFVLLLDDLWERVDLQSIGIPPSPENKKSKVIFTTRSEIVCGHMDANIKFRVECLPWKEAWTLFQEKVGNEALNSFPDARELAKIVAKECDGLPLALITIGRAMSTKKTVQEWNHAITTLRRAASEFPGMGEPVFPMGKAVFPLLKVSYDSLGKDTIKSCFLYCALLPEDESIYLQKLVDYWIGEGFILLSDFNHLDEARNYGYDVIGDLKGACLLESGDYGEPSVKMHDIIRDMALWITRECGSNKMDKMLTIEAFDGTTERLWYNAQRIYLMDFCRDETEVPSLESPNLLTLIHTWRRERIFFVPQNCFQFMPLLRVLDLAKSRMKTFPISITGLVELQYLSLSWTHIDVIPEELRNLVKLNYLDLSHMMHLRKIPSGVIGSSLLELRVLNLYSCSGADYWDLEEVYKLKHLNDLGITIKTHHNLNKLLSNKNLQMCTRHLVLSNSFLFDQQSEDITTSSPIITSEKLQLLFNLEKLSLNSFNEAELMNMGIEQQHHLGSCFQNLIDIHFSHCNGLKDLTWVGYVSNLKRLTVGSCKELEEIVIVVVDDDLGGSTAGGGENEIISSSSSSSSSSSNNVKDVFKRLRVLLMVDLPKLKSICRSPLAFPCLESMDVLKCPQLKKLPFHSATNVNNTLRKISGGPKWWSELQWEEDNNNNNNELLKSKFLPYFIERSFYDDLHTESGSNNPG